MVTLIFLVIGLDFVMLMVGMISNTRMEVGTTLSP